MVGATPELYIRRNRAGAALAGAGRDDAARGHAGADEALGAALLASAKDLDEHQYGVADVRAALHRSAATCGSRLARSCSG